jgi:hypothetical protein
MSHTALRSFRFICAALLATLICSPALVAQSGTGVITGLVMDPSGAFVPGAEVVLIEQNTGIRHTHVTTEAGTYRARHLPPGDYRVTASLNGFKTAVADNVILLLSQTLRVDLTLEVGDITEVVVVSSTGPLLETSSSEVGTNANQKEVHSWPILVDSWGTRELQQFVFSTMPGTTARGFAGSINGGQVFSHEILLEGITFGRMTINGYPGELTPTMDAVSEFTLQSGGGLSSNLGATHTGLTSFGMRSGTNAFHGTAFWFHQNEKLRANSWSANARNLEKTPFVLNSFGATVGGPILRDRTHFFFSYEGTRFRDTTISGFRSLPQRTFKEGNFAQLLDSGFTGDGRSGTVQGQDALGRDVLFGQIYDPTSSRQLDDGTWIRDPFPGNIIPQDRFSAVTSNILDGHDIPDPLDPTKLFNNNPALNHSWPWREYNYFSIKMDHVLAEKHRLSGTYIKNIHHRDGVGTYEIPGLPIPGPAAAGDSTRDEGGWMLRLSEDWTISPTLLNHLAFGYNRFLWGEQANSFRTGIDWKQELGLQNDQPGRTFPVARFAAPDSTLSGDFSDYGKSKAYESADYSWILADDLSWMWKNHSLRFGFEHRRYSNDDERFQTNGVYTFLSFNTAIPGSYRYQTGFAYASFLLGEAYRADMPIQKAGYNMRSHLTALYVHDDWKIKPNFTLNLGFRWDIPTPIFDKSGRQSSLNPYLPNPAADGFPGALDFLEGPDDRWAEIYWKQVAPRLGFAWSPRLDLVVRGGYGINYAPPLRDGWYSDYMAGFNGSNPIYPYPGNSASRFLEDSAFQWDQHYPVYAYELPNTDPSLLNGNVIDWYLGEDNNSLGINISKQPMVQNWNLGVQYDIGWDTKIEANYVGNKGKRLNEPQYLSRRVEGVDPIHLSLGDTLIEDIEDHPEYKPYPSFKGTVAQALRPFPQYYDIATHRLNGGWSNYHAVQVTATKRSSFGLSFLASYTFSKTLATNDSAGPATYYHYGQDYYNRNADYGVSKHHVPHYLKLAWIYDLPFGPQGKWATSGWQSALLGGWSLSAIHQYRSGWTIIMYGAGSAYRMDALFNSNIRPDVLLGSDWQKVPFSGDVDSENGTQYLNPEAFGLPPKTDKGVPLRFGTASRILPQTMSPMLPYEDFSLIKRTPLGFREGATLEIRFDFANLLNRARLPRPNSSITSPRFGKFFHKAGPPRTVQAGLRVNW